MALNQPSPGDTQSSLTDVVIALDIDNTLMDPDGAGYRETTAEFMAFVDIGLSPNERLRAYEGLRARGDALEQLGLGNPLHERNHPEALAVLCVTRCANSGLRRDLQINPDDQPRYREFVIELAKRHDKTGRGSAESRLAAEIAFRRFCTTDPRVVRFCNEVKRVAQYPRITVWAQHYEAIERQRPVTSASLPLDALATRDAIPIVITEGRGDVQARKLDALGLAGSFQDRVLITEAVAAVPGVKKLDEAISRRIDARIRSANDVEDRELSCLWHYRCLIGSWETKTPWFFGRCLHAIQNQPRYPALELSRPVFVPADRWGERPLYFVMVGDRYDKDIAPLIDLLGPGAGMKIRLQMGKYGHLHPESDLPPDRRPDRTFADWNALTSFLTEELVVGQIKPITTPPDIVDRAAVRPDYVEQGLASEYEAVSLVATAVAEMIR